MPPGRVACRHGRHRAGSAEPLGQGAVVSQSWLRQPERGSYLALRLITWIATRFGRRLSRVLLYPISAYFVLFSGSSRRASLDYLQRVRGQAANWLEALGRDQYFASPLPARAYFL